MFACTRLSRCSLVPLLRSGFFVLTICRTRYHYSGYRPATPTPLSSGCTLHQLARQLRQQHTVHLNLLNEFIFRLLAEILTNRPCVPKSSDTVEEYNPNTAYSSLSVQVEFVLLLVSFFVSWKLQCLCRELRICIQFIFTHLVKSAVLDAQSLKYLHHLSL